MADSLPVTEPDSAAPSQPTEGVAETRQESPPEATGAGTRLPTYTRGLLRIRVPVRVTLAAQRKSIQEILELGPGSIVRFDKTCGDPLELTVCDHPIATGEVVKVGDKFGLRIGARV